MNWKDYLSGTAGPGIPLLLYWTGIIKPAPGDAWMYRGLFPAVIVWLLMEAFHAYRKAAVEKSQSEQGHNQNEAKP